MKQILQNMRSCLSLMKSQDNIQRIYSYFKNKKYIWQLISQYEDITTNVKSISLLVETGNINDAYTIFRKYLETYFIMMSLIVHPDLADEYVKHNEMLSLKACRKDLDIVRAFSEGKPDNYLEYGYLEKYIDHNQSDFKYSAKSAAIVGDVLQFHWYYKMSNNFVHNNLTSVKVDQAKGKETLIKAVKETTDLMNSKIELIINKA